MTKVEMLIGENSPGEEPIIGFAFHGHSGFASHGEDIVCASLSFAMHILEHGIRWILGIPCAIDTNKQDGFFRIKWDGEYAEQARIHSETIGWALQQLSDQYPDNVKFTKEVVA